MHENGAAAGKSEPSWYLARGYQQWGPLADRELLLLAERGGLKTEDLLWKPGFESRQPVRAVCDFLPSMHATKAETAVCSETPRSKPSLKARLYHEFKSFLLIFSYLWLVFF